LTSQIDRTNGNSFKELQINLNKKSKENIFGFFCDLGGSPCLPTGREPPNPQSRNLIFPAGRQAGRYPVACLPARTNDHKQKNFKSFS
jgi:hypothetical protein